MGLNFRHLDDVTRRYMIEEINLDVEQGTVYVSNYLNAYGSEVWVDLLREAASSGTDDTLASMITERKCLKHQVERKKPTGGYTLAKVPITAHQTMGEGEFGRYYVRGLCRRAIDEGIVRLEVYRAKEVMVPRPGSEEKIGTLVVAAEILDDLRTMVGVEPLLGLPPGPNSGLTLCYPTDQT